MIFRNNKKNAIISALKLKGWTSEEKLEQLYDLVKSVKHVRGSILEIGSAWGRSTVVLAKADKNKVVFSVDPHTGGLVYINKGVSQDSYSEFVTNMKLCKVSDRVSPIKHTTMDVVENNLLNEPISFAFIDGLHTYEGVSIDFDFAYQKTVKGSIIAFDDYFEDSIKEYREAIDEKTDYYGVRLIKDKRTRLVFFTK